MKEEFIKLLKETNREGMDKVISFLENSDFFTAPASTRFHGDHEGGLVEHSLNVYKLLNSKIKFSKPFDMAVNDNEDTIKIVSLLHDVCKVNYYQVDYRNVKNEQGVWERVPYYKVADTVPYGHGEKSVMMISRFIDLTMHEMYAIRWHMGFTEPKELYGTISETFNRCPLALALHEADLEASYILEKKEEN